MKNSSEIIMKRERKKLMDSLKVMQPLVHFQQAAQSHIVLNIVF